ncbi:hypothetical protein TWF481_006095 [Arthrobotrys musiformis]|uniref:Ammonium transporter AmtB-like domain-containing protein n=1 Tax=Arthrobotrys musiformis TaxID=47236 RepID=A0AAV9WFR6_9PEZI
MVSWAKDRYGGVTNTNGTPVNGAAGNSKHVGATVSWLKRFVQRYDDPFEVFAIHTIGGLVGLFLTGIFASRDVVALDPQAYIDPDGLGVIDGNTKRLRYQVIDGAACFSWSFFVTLLMLLIMDNIPTLHLRYREEDMRSIDLYELGNLETLATPQPGLLDPTNQGSQ